MQAPEGRDMIRDYQHAAWLQARHEESLPVGDELPAYGAGPVPHNVWEAVRQIDRFIIRAMVPLTWKRPLCAHPLVVHAELVRAGAYAGHPEAQAIARAFAEQVTA